jgi:hypothetical protein
MLSVSSSLMFPFKQGKNPLLMTPLHALEQPPRKLLGPRAPGQPFGEWLLLKALKEAVVIHQPLRFDPRPADPDEQIRLEKFTHRICVELESPRRSAI